MILSLFKVEILIMRCVFLVPFGVLVGGKPVWSQFRKQAVKFKKIRLAHHHLTELVKVHGS